MICILKNERGNMLLGILASIAIMALMTALSIPYIKTFQTNFILSGAAKDLVSELRYAQQLTITEQVVHKIYFDQPLNKYELLRMDPATTTLKTVQLPAGVRIFEVESSLNNVVIFNSFGGVSQSGAIILTNSNNGTSTINIKPSGYIQLN